MRDSIDELRRRRREAPDDLLLAIRLALALDRKDRDEEALEAWERVLELDGAVALAWSRIARAQLLRRRSAASLEAFREAFRCALGEAPESTSLVLRGLSLLKDKAASMRSRASSLSTRLRRSTISQDPDAADPERAAGIWVKAAKKLDGPADVSLAALGRAARALGLTGWPATSEASNDRIRLLSPRSPLSHQTLALLQAEDGLGEMLDLARARLALLASNLHSRGAREALVPGDERRWLVLQVRSSKEPRGLLAAFPHAELLGTVLWRSDDEVLLLDPVDRPIAGFAGAERIVPYVQDRIVASLACELADLIARDLLEDA